MSLKYKLNIAANIHAEMLSGKTRRRVIAMLSSVQKAASKFNQTKQLLAKKGIE